MMTKSTPVRVATRNTVPFARKRTITRVKDGRFCSLHVELRDGDKGLVLSITGTEGVVLTERQARAQAIDYWRSFFEDSPEERHAMNDRCGCNCRTALGAARYVVKHDGEYHGLDIAYVDDAKDDEVYVVEGCGQMRETLAKWFPEAEPMFKWHLNDMRASPDGEAWLYEELPSDVVTWALEGSASFPPP